MGYWENTGYIASRDTAAIARHITSRFAMEGMERIPRPSQRERVLVEPMQYETALRNNTWALGIFPGATGWNVAKTAPLDLLGERAPGATLSRFVEICNALGAPGFLLSVYDGSSAVLVETDGAGRQLISGYCTSSSDPLLFYGTPLSEERVEIRFECLAHLQPLIDESHYPNSGYVDPERLCSVLAAQLGGDNADYCDNLTSVVTLISHAPLSAIGGVDLYFRCPASDRPEPPRFSSWEDWKKWKSTGQ